MSRRRRREHEVPEMVAMLERVARALVRRAADGDLEAVSGLDRAQQAMGEALAQAVVAAHGEPFNYSWTEIGRELGTTRQAAQQRFGISEPQSESA